MHKLLFDQNLSYRIIKEIASVFPDSSHVKLLNLDQSDDLTIWQYAKENSFHIVTKDTDFNNLSTLNGYPPKIIWINSGNISTQAIVELLKKKYEIITNFLDNENMGLLEIN